MLWLLGLVRLPGRMIARWRRQTALMQARRAEGRCVICGAPAVIEDYCVEDWQDMRGPH